MSGFHAEVARSQGNSFAPLLSAHGGRVAQLIQEAERRWKQVWAEMTDPELEDRLFMYLWLSRHAPNAQAGRVARSFRNDAGRLGWQREPA